MKQQRGIALITILMMVALATIVAATIAKRQHATYEQTAYLMRQNQGLLYAKSAEAFYAELLVEDAKSNSKADYLQETWAKTMPPFPVDGGVVSGVLEDETGKFNLNNLVQEDGQPSPEAQVYFEALLMKVGLPAELSQSVIDWQDADDLTVGPMGAESAYYMGLRPSYLPSNTTFLNKEELKQVRGFEGENYDLIAPYVTAMPKRGAKININTAPAMVLAAFAPNLNVDEIQQLFEQRNANMEYFERVSDLWELAPFNSVNQDRRKQLESQLDVKSSLFKIMVTVMFDRRQRQFTSYLIREDQTVYTYARSLAPF